MALVPNALTILRLCLVPLLIVLMLSYSSPFDSMMWWAFAIFALAGITDKLDGDIARSYNLVSNFGKIADPIADKALVLPALFIVVWNMSGFFISPVVFISWVCVIAILIRELGISVWRMVLVRSGRVVPASAGGKLKTVAQMGFIGLRLVPWNTFLPNFVAYSIGYLTWLILLLATYLALKSGWDYIRS
ncbi:CDP-diacylglycerol--glycerol-3-phosphate 3-phosphatidyltransferase [Actinomycetaceae bacterium TAE3-ERU4]|nr:CDP-diacylglycerol--glycerol-3-phosphate 3-phosphatidyltransferase [Actinomycetaceae bacterium TAE3-ERU4]